MRDDMRAGDPIWVVPYDVEWPRLFAQQGIRLREALGPVALRIDHIGSTSVPGLTAKPVIDVQISVAALEPPDAFLVPLEAAGYRFRADNAERTKRYFREGPGERRTHIHVRRAGTFSEQFALLFREFLRAHPDVAVKYGELKVGLTALYSGAEQRHAYTEAKAPFIWGVMAQADAWGKSVV